MQATRRAIQATGHERFLGENELIVSKTDPQGRITYANRTFERISGFDQDDLMGAAHSIVRHPDMPRGVFKLLWDTIESGREVFAYVVNHAKNGDHYWVFAHVTPSFDATGRVIGYHSNRRKPERTAVEAIKSVYALLLAEERRFDGAREAADAGFAKLQQILAAKGVTYEQFVFSL